MTRRLLSRVLAILCSAAAVWVVATPAVATSDPTADATLEHIATCLNGTDRLLLALVVDESGSLRTTDPTNERVPAAKAALRAFAALASGEGAATAPGIDIFVGGFSSRLSPVVPWTPLNEQSQPTIDATLDGFATRNNGIDTDFPTALLGVQREFAARSAELSTTGGDTPCKVILLFTDGRYDIEAGDSAARREAGLTKEYAPGLSLDDEGNEAPVEAAGRDYLCRRGGGALADQLRNDGVTTVTIALSAQIEPADQQFLRALSSGEADSLVCGDERGAAAGAYLGTGSLAELVPLFNRVASSITGGTEAPGETVEGTCAQTRCERASRTFALDPGVRRFTLLGDTDESGLNVELEPPEGGDPITLQPSKDGADARAGIDLRWTWLSTTTVSIEADLPAGDDAWVGAWTARFLDPDGRHADADPRADIFLYGAWAARFVDEPRFLLGEKSELRLEIVDEAGESVDPDTFGARTRIAVSVTDPENRDTARLEVTAESGGLASATHTVAKNTRSSVLDVAVRLDVRTASGAKLAARIEKFRIPVSAPLLYPQLEATELRLSSVRGTGSARGSLVVTGGRDRGGCVWVGQPSFDAFPADASRFATATKPATSEQSCVEIIAGESREIEVSMRNAAAASGTVRGTLPVSLKAAGEDDVLLVEVPFSFDLAPPINEARRAGLFLAIFLPGVLLPVLALGFGNRLLARFEPAKNLRVARVPVAVERTFSRVMRVFVAGEEAGVPLRRLDATASPGNGDANAAFHLGDADFNRLSDDAQRSRVMRWNELTFRACAPRNPFGAPYGTVEATAPCAAGGVGIDPHTERLPLALPGTWVFLYDEVTRDDGTDREWVRGDLVVFLADGPVKRQLDPIEATIIDQLRVAANDLADRTRDR